MNLRERILKTEEEFPIIFTNTIEKDYGLIFYNEKNRESNDSNHAILYPEKITNLENVITEIKDFYLNKNLEPIIYQPFETGYFEKNIEIFEKCGYQIEKYGFNEFLLLEPDNQIISKGNLSIKLITEWDNRIADDIYTPDDDIFTPTVIKNALRDKNYRCFVGYVDGKAVTTASVYYSEYNCARLDSVETAFIHRGKGYSRELMSHIVEYHKRNFNNFSFATWPANDTAKRIYIEAGFRFLFEVEAGSATFASK